MKRHLLRFALGFGATAFTLSISSLLATGGFPPRIWEVIIVLGGIVGALCALSLFAFDRQDGRR